jgi:toxin ParE1/3/4
MLWSVNITAEAKIDIQEGIHWYNNKQKGLGKRFHKEVKNCIARIEKNPFYVVKYNQTRCMPIPKFPYLIHFIIEESDKNVIILGILHTSLNPNENWFLD